MVKTMNMKTLFLWVSFYMFSIIKYRNDEQDDEWLYYKTPHIEREEVAYPKLCVYTI